MKFRRYLSFLLAIIITVCLTVALNFNFVKADDVSAGETDSQPEDSSSGEESGEPEVTAKDVYRVTSVSYNVEALLKDLGVEPLEGRSKITDGRSVSYRLSMTADGTEVVDGDDNYKESSFKALTDTVEFLSTGTYTIVVTVDDTDETTEYTVTVKNKITPADEDYNNTSVSFKQDFSGYIEKIEENAQGLKTGDSYIVPSIEDYIESVDFEYNDLQKIVYYCAPNSTTYTQGSAVTTTDPSFTVSYRGTYSFYILFKDALTNTMSTENLVLGDNGWYKKDADGNPQGDIVIPVFSFVVAENAPPEIAVRASEDAYLNLSYEIESFVITANGGNREYNLYYSQTYFDKDDEAYISDDDYISAVIAGSENITDDYLNRSALTFTPDKNGYYYVEVKVVDDYNMAETAMSRAIRCNGEARSVQYAYAPDTVSIIFLSIAGVCFVAIILLLVIKPKEAETVELKNDSKK